MAGGFDRIRPRGEGAVPSPARPDAQGRQALFTDGEDLKVTGIVTVNCSSCHQISTLGFVEAMWQFLPSVHFPLLGIKYPSIMRCPSCRRLTWVKVGLKI